MYLNASFTCSTPTLLARLDLPGTHYTLVGTVNSELLWLGLAVFQLVISSFVNEIVRTIIIIILLVNELL